MRRPIFDAIEMLTDRAEASLTRDEWQQLTELGEAACDEALRLAEVAEKLGCLICSDEGAESPSGWFSGPGDVSNLMWMVSHSLQGLAAMSKLAAYAAFKLRHTEGGPCA